MSAPLPDPSITLTLDQCPVCGYSLAGLARPAPCPECGVALPDQVLLLHGIPRGMPGASKGFRLGAMIAVLSLWLGPQVLLITLMPRYGFYGATAAFLGVAIAVAAFIYFNRFQSSGSARIAISSLGIGLQPLNPREDESGRVFFPWHGDEVYRVIRVGGFWRRLVVRRRDGTRVIEIGFRCPDAMHETLVQGFAAAFPRPTPNAVPTTPMSRPASPQELSNQFEDDASH